MRPCRGFWLVGFGLNGGAEKQREDEFDNAQDGVGHEHGSVGINGCPAVDLLESLNYPATDDCADGCAGGADEGVPCENVTPDILVGQLSECGFFDRAEGTDLIATV